MPSARAAGLISSGLDERMSGMEGVEAEKAAGGLVAARMCCCTGAGTVFVRIAVEDGLRGSSFSDILGDGSSVDGGRIGEAVGCPSKGRLTREEKESVGSAGASPVADEF